MSSPNPNDVTSWRVTGQTELTQVQAGGNPVRGVQVFFTTAAGHTGSVFVPYAQYNQQNVASVVQAAAANMDAIGALTSGPAS